MAGALERMVSIPGHDPRCKNPKTHQQMCLNLSREAPVCLERTLKRPERPTQTCGMPEGSLAEVADSNSGWLIQIVSTLRAFCFFGLYDEWRGLKENL